MKAAFVFLFALAAASAFTLPEDNEAVIFKKGGNSPIDKLIKQALEYIRKMLKEKEPFPVPKFPPQPIKDENVDIVVDLDNIKIAKASDFKVDEIDNDLKSLTAEFGVSLPSLHLDGDYKVSGTFKGKSVTGKGSFTVDLTEFVQKGQIKASLANHEVQLKELHLEYDFKDVDFKLPGLNIEGMTQPQVETLLNKQFKEYIQTQKADVAAHVAEQVKNKANEIMKGKSLTEVLNWLKKMIGQ